MTARPESDSQYVTIPYFLYEAMARMYYGRVNGDFPVTRPIASETPDPKFTGNFTMIDDDIPATWKPQGAAQRTPSDNPKPAKSPK